MVKLHSFVLHEFVDELGLTTFSVTFVFTEAVVSSGRVEKSPHEQEIKFFAKVVYTPKKSFSI